MNLHQLEYALTLERTGSFTKAAKSLQVTQPALSSQIKNLENEIGITLFERSKTKIEPTQQGLKFLLKASEIVSASKQLKDYAHSLGQDYSGTLRVGIIPTLSPFLVPLFMDDFTQTYPDIILEVHELLTEEVLQKVRLGELDGGIISTPIGREGMTVKPLFYEAFYLYENDKNFERNETLEISNIDMNALWLLEEGNCFRDQINDICSFRGKRHASRLRYFCSSIDSLIRMVDHYGGSTILPELTTLSLSDEQEKHVGLLQGKVREIGYISKKFTGKEQLSNALQDTIKRNIPKRMQSLSKREVVDPGIKVQW